MNTLNKIYSHIESTDDFTVSTLGDLLECLAYDATMSKDNYAYDDIMSMKEAFKKGIEQNTELVNHLFAVAKKYEEIGYSNLNSNQQAMYIDIIKTLVNT